MFPGNLLIYIKGLRWFLLKNQGVKVFLGNPIIYISRGEGVFPKNIKGLRCFCVIHSYILRGWGVSGHRRSPGYCRISGHCSSPGHCRIYSLYLGEIFHLCTVSFSALANYRVIHLVIKLFASALLHFEHFRNIYLEMHWIRCLTSLHWYSLPCGRKIHWQVLSWPGLFPGSDAHQQQRSCFLIT